MIKFHNITHDDMLNGDGLRVVLWVSGCEHHCKGCQNPDTWDPEIGVPFDEWNEAEFWTWLSKPWTKGATFSGGDPLHPNNREKIGDMIMNIKKNFPGKDVWVYTGYRLNDGLMLEDAYGNEFHLSYLENIDVLVDGKFECDTRKKDIATKTVCHWRGSSNQRVIDVKATLQTGHVVERE